MFGFARLPPVYNTYLFPPLRERGNDVILLADHYLSLYARKYKKELKGITRDAKGKLLGITRFALYRKLDKLGL